MPIWPAAQHGGDVVQVRHVRYTQRLAAQQRRAQYRQRRILGAGNAHFAVSGTPPWMTSLSIAANGAYLRLAHSSGV